MNQSRCGQVKAKMDPFVLDNEANLGLAFTLFCIAGFGYLLGKLKILNLDNINFFIQAVSIGAGLYVAFNLDAPASSFSFLDRIGAGVFTYYFLSIVIGFVLLMGVGKAEEEPPKK
jgi:hypothetical protein